MSSDMLESTWKDIKKDIMTIWSQITADELEQSRGQMMSISRLIEKKYDHEKEEIIEKLKSVFKKFGQTTEDIKNEIAAEK